jgi:hypothetical protein
MRLALILVATAVLALSVPAAASGATLTATPDKPCYGTGEKVTFRGAGFTAGGIVDFTRDGTPIPTRNDEDIRAGSSGDVVADLPVANARGSETRTYAAIDRTNPANTASIELRISELSVQIRPDGGQPSRPRRIRAVGFTQGSTLYAHISHRGKVRNLRIGTVTGRCGRVEARRRLFGPRAPNGRHVIRFDTRRRYLRRPPAQRYRWRFTIFSPGNR